MRQGQQNRRGRGRNRKGQSPLTRSFESKGPDVKIRGTPSHIAEKYMSLARDATSSGDPVLAENYLQHAEHYNRIIMAFREQQMAQNGGEMNGGPGRHRQFAAQDPSMEGNDDFQDDDGDDDGRPSPMRPNEPQPRIDGFEGGNGGGGREQRFRGRGRGGDRGFRNQQQADAGSDAGGQAAEGGSSRRGGGDRFGQSHEQPEFLRRPVRRPRRESASRSADAGGGTAAVAEDADSE